MNKPAYYSSYLFVRWLVLVATLTNIFINLFGSELSGHPSVSMVSAAYPVLLSPAPYSFSIWGLIFLSLVLYSIVQLMPNQRHSTGFDRLSVGMILLNMALACWPLAFTSGAFVLASVLSLIALVAALSLFRIAWRLVYHRNMNLWIQFPFSLLSAWLTIATILCILITLKHYGIAFSLSDTMISSMLIIAVSVVSVIISLRSHSLVYPSVICWALAAIEVSQRHDAPKIAALAAICGYAQVCFCLLTAFFKRMRLGSTVGHAQH